MFGKMSLLKKISVKGIVRAKWHLQYFSQEPRIYLRATELEGSIPDLQPVILLHHLEEEEGEEKDTKKKKRTFTQRTRVFHTDKNKNNAFTQCLDLRTTFADSGGRRVCVSVRTFAIRLSSRPFPVAVKRALLTGAMKRRNKLADGSCSCTNKRRTVCTCRARPDRDNMADTR